MVLIQQHLVLHYTFLEDGLAYYEADWEAAYDLIRSGKIVTLAEMRFGQTSGELVSNLLLQGHTRIGDLVEAYTDTLVAGRPQKKDGNDKTDETAVTGTDATDLCSAGYSSEQPASKQASLTQLRDILERFDEHQFIYTVLQHQFYPHSDIVNELSRHLRKRGFQEGIKGSARSLEFGGHLRRLLSRLRDDDDHAGSVPGQTRTLKRILDETGSGPQAKRAKIVITDDGPLSETSHRWPDGTHIQDVGVTDGRFPPIGPR